ncbi:glutamate--tRNA ligase family protein [Shumkonia mesophila]|uniref:glutamate--tRNA ligase family protein n=1 Tax=Shumkonia mesophila TaxID=2838854 RepID=UPI002934C4DF|nr:glutamate--tRNA ligase family protein [Shumkonia mesophila]
MSPVVRFAAIPSRPPHVGDARVALVNGLFAKARGGTFLVRLDEAAAEEATAEAAIAIERDLLWMGLEWGAFARQSERTHLYRDAVAQLLAAGRVYATEDGAAEPGWRFRLAAGEMAWDDLVQGRQAVEASGLSDPLVMRPDGTCLQLLASVVDDIDLGVTDVIRGADHIAKAAVQIQLFEALGTAPPAFGHLPMLTDGTGKPLGKRLAPLTVESIRDAGIEAMALNSLLAGLGRGQIIEPSLSLSDLAADLDLASFGRFPPAFDLDALRQLNARLIGQRPPATTRIP